MRSIGIAGLICASLAVGPALAADPTPAPGCAFQPIDIDKYGGAPFAQPSELRSENGVLETTLTVAYAENTIADCRVRLRSYNGGLVGPTLRVKPGDTLKIKLDNRLPPNPAGAGHGSGHGAAHGAADGDINIPHDFNTTNLHTHGLWVSPMGNGDNVTLRIEPGTSFDYEIAIPEDHPSGTFWYHAHIHGATALQVSSGIAGALIVEGGLDTVPQIAAAEDNILVFQQIAYDEQGEIENYDDFGPGVWAKTHRQTTINGQIVPTITMRPGEVQRWRMIHAGVRETISPAFKRMDDAAGPHFGDLNGLAPATLAALPSAVSFHEIAVDGLALGRIDTWPVIELQPGYRSDVLVRAPAVDRTTTFLLTDGELAPEASLLGDPEPERILARIVVSGATVDMPLPTDEDVAGFLPHRPITDAELDGVPQTVRFDIANRLCDPNGVCIETCDPDTDAGCATRFMVNDRPFSNAHDRLLTLGTAAEWTLSGEAGNHPFHIHVNPFQTTRIGPDGREQIVWRDTLLVRQGAAPVKVRMRYRRFIGTFVLHCHILDHEDQGMMELVTISNPQ